MRINTWFAVGVAAASISQAALFQRNGQWGQDRHKFTGIQTETNDLCSPSMA